MEYTNTLSKQSAKPDTIVILYSHLLISLYPFAPHLCSEIFEQLWGTDIQETRISLDYKTILSQIQSKIPFRVQINGKFVVAVELPKGAIGDAAAILFLL